MDRANRWKGTHIVDETAAQSPGQREEDENVCSTLPDYVPALHKEVSAIIMCGVAQDYRHEGRSPLSNGLIQTQGVPLFHSLPPGIISHSLLPSLPHLSISQMVVHLPLCATTLICSPLTWPFYLGSNSHHFNRDKITLWWAPVPAGLYMCFCPNILCWWWCLPAHSAVCSPIYLHLYNWTL